MKQGSCLVIVDVQNDFCPNGALAVSDGDSVVPVLNKYIDMFKDAGFHVFASRDWHPEKTVHFKEYGGKWPPHCVAGTKGAEFHPGLKLSEDVSIITKGTLPNEDSYSAFQGRDPQGRSFSEVLRTAGIVRIYVGGLATDYCVKQTVLDALGEGFKVTVLVDAIKGVEVNEGDSRRALDEMTSKGADTIDMGSLKKELQISASRS